MTQCSLAGSSISTLHQNKINLGIQQIKLKKHSCQEKKNHYKILTIVKFKQAYTLKILHIPFSPLFFTNKDLSQYGNLI